jgi:dihydroorotase
MCETSHASGVADWLIRGADTIAQDGVLRRADVVITGGRIESFGQVGAARARRTIDADGLLLVAGLIDLHAHFYHDVIATSVAPDPTCLPFGVTTAVDGGTAGCHTYRGLRRHVIDKSATRVLAFLNMGAAGFATLPALGELADRTLHRPAEMLALIRSDPRIRGIKLRLARDALGGTDPLEMLDSAIRLAEEAQLPVMTHVEDDCPIPISDLLGRMRPGDIVTHIYHGGENGILDQARHVLVAVRDAVQRGVLLDVGHGGTHFDISVARDAIAQGLVPTTISTDGWSGRPGTPPQYALPHIVSELIALGVGLGAALAAVTRAPAAALGLASDLGVLQEGGRADVAAYRRVDGRFRFTDNRQDAVVASMLLEPEFTFRRGELVTGISRSPAFSAPESLEHAT